MAPNPVMELRRRLESGLSPAAHTPPASPAAAFKECRRAILGVTALSAVINLLYLTSSLFMMEVYDRVIPSRSEPTLVALCVVALMLYGFQGGLDLIRTRIFVRIGNMLDARLARETYRAAVTLALTQNQVDPLQPSRDLDQVRQFLSGGGPVGFLDMPWLPLYLLICFAFHPLIGFAALAGSATLIVITLLTDRGARAATAESAQHAVRRARLAEASRRYAEIIQAMGMRGAIGGRWSGANLDYLRTSGRASDVVGGFGAFSKVFRVALQSMVLALGAWLVIHQQATAGIILASSILVSRALSPVETVIAHWKGFVAARLAWGRLRKALSSIERQPMRLPAPARMLAVEKVTLAPPGATTATVFDVSFSLRAGSALGVIGRSASGKSSLARSLVGAWQPVRGHVRLDDATLDQWSSESLGPHIGYMPQESGFFAGTVGENIARFTADAPPEAIVAAAKAAGAHELVLQLPQGYDTPLGEDGTALSIGQRQRIALARALYGDPFLVVLDEPNANLDQEGDAALTGAIEGVRARGGIVVVIAHRPAAIAACDLVMVMAAGRVHMFGPKDEVLSAATRPTQPSVSPATNRQAAIR